MPLGRRARVVVFGSVLVASGLAGPALAGSVGGTLELPVNPERPAAATRGFLDRVENPLAPARTFALTPHLLVALEGAARPTASQVTWDLVGESFARPVIGASVGGEVVIKNLSRQARTLVAAQDPNLIAAGPINPTGPKSFRASEPKVYTIADKDAPHLMGTVVVVDGFVATVDDGGKFEFPDVPEGTYKLKVFFKDAWLDVTADVQVSAKGKTEVNPKLPALSASAKK